MYMEDGDYFVEVRDRGEGHPGSRLKRIFEPFYRCDKSRSKEISAWPPRAYAREENRRSLGWDMRRSGPPRRRRDVMRHTNSSDLLNENAGFFGPILSLKTALRKGT